MRYMAYIAAAVGVMGFIYPVYGSWAWGSADGDITHYRLHVEQDCGAYGEIGAVLPMLTMMMATGTYSIPNVQYSSRSIVTNTTPNASGVSRLLLCRQPDGTWKVPVTPTDKK